MEPKTRGRHRYKEVDKDAFMEELNRCGNITRAAIAFQLDPNIVKAQFMRHNLRIGRQFRIVKNEDAVPAKQLDKKLVDGEMVLSGGRKISIQELEDTLNETGNMSLASLKLGLVDSGIRTLLKYRGYDLKIEFILIPASSPKSPRAMTSWS